MSITLELARTAPADVAASAVGAVKGQSEGGGLDWGHLAGLGFEGKKGDVRAVPGPDGGTTFVVGLGPAEEVDADVLRSAAGSVVRAAKRFPSLSVDLLGALPATHDGPDRRRRRSRKASCWAATSSRRTSPTPSARSSSGS